MNTRLLKPSLWALVAVAAAAVAPPTVPAQEALRATPRDADCAPVLEELNPGLGEFEAGACQLLALEIQDDLYVRRRIAARALQVPHGQVGNAAGSPAQGTTVADVQPLPLAGGSLAAVGTDAGTGAIAALVVNPAGFAVDAEADPEAAIRLTDIGDITVLVPVALFEEGLTDDGFEYLGLRARVNVTGVVEGGARYRQALAAYGQLQQSSAVEVTRLIELLVGAPDVGACTAALRADPVEAGAVERACGAPLPALGAGAYADFERALQSVIAEADRRLFGLDLRLDVGDPSLGAVEAARGTRLFAGAVASRRLDGQRPGTTGLSARLGVLAVDLHDVDASTVAVEGGVGYELSRVYGVQRLSAAAGFEFRYSNASAFAEALGTDFACLRASVNIPLAAENSVAVNVALPVAGALGPTVNVRINWSLRWPSVPGLIGG